MNKHHLSKATFLTVLEPHKSQSLCGGEGYVLRRWNGEAGSPVGLVKPDAISMHTHCPACVKALPRKRRMGMTIANTGCGTLMEEALAVVLEAREERDEYGAFIVNSVLLGLELALAKEAGYGMYAPWDLDQAIDKVEDFLCDQ